MTPEPTPRQPDPDLLGEYDRERREWLESHHAPTPAQYERAMRRIAEGLAHERR